MTNPSEHAPFTIGYEQSPEPHIQGGECYCLCLACTANDESCICPDCDPVLCQDRPTPGGHR